MSVEPRSPGMGPRSRRDVLLGTGAVVVGAATLSACGDGDEPPAGEPPNPERDAAVLAPLLDQEYAAVVAYGAIGEALAGDARRLAAGFRALEEEHAERVKAAIERIGRTAPGPQDEDDYRRGFPDLATAEDALEFAADVERTAIASYLAATAKLSTAAMRGEVAAIVTTEAEQLSVLLLEQGRSPLPEPFVGGDPLPL